MLVVSFGQSGFDSSGVIPAANIALEDINKDPNVLPGYNLTYDEVRDSQVSQLFVHGDCARPLLSLQLTSVYDCMFIYKQEFCCN